MLFWLPSGLDTIWLLCRVLFVYGVETTFKADRELPTPNQILSGPEALASFPLDMLDIYFLFWIDYGVLPISD